MRAVSARHLVFVALYTVAGSAFAAPFLPPDILKKYAWAFFHFADFSPATRAALLAFALAAAHLLSPQRVGKLLSQMPQGVRVGSRGWLAAGVAASLPIFWIFRDTNFELGDSALLIRVLTRDVHMRGFHITFDEPLELYAHSVAYDLLHRLAGWDVARSYALLSALAGSVAVAVLIAFCSRITSRPGDRGVALAMFLSSGFFSLFFGHVENYTLVLLGLIVYLLVSRRTLQHELGLFWPALTLSISLCLHALAGFFLPSLLWLWRERRVPASGNVRDLLMIAIGLTLPVVSTFALCAWIGFSPDNVRSTHAVALKFIPLLGSDYPDRQYSFLSPTHIVAVINELVLTALPGLLAIATVVWARVRSRTHMSLLNAPARFLLVFALCGQFLALTWHPDLGPYRDWDLFAVVGLGYAALGAFLLVRVGAASDARAYSSGSVTLEAGLPIVVFCGVLTFTWIFHNARQQVHVDDRHDSIHEMLERSS